MRGDVDLRRAWPAKRRHRQLPMRSRTPAHRVDLPGMRRTRCRRMRRRVALVRQRARRPPGAPPRLDPRTGARDRPHGRGRRNVGPRRPSLSYCSSVSRPATRPLTTAPTLTAPPKTRSSCARAASKRTRSSGALADTPAGVHWRGVEGLPPRPSPVRRSRLPVRTLGSERSSGGSQTPGSGGSSTTSGAGVAHPVGHVPGALAAYCLKRRSIAALSVSPSSADLAFA